MADGSARPGALLGVAATAVAGGAVVGGSTNAVNGAVSPLYFREVLGWQDVANVWRASIAQGVFEGLLYGVVFALVFTLVVGIVSKARCPYGFAARRLLGIVAAVYACWVAGGLVAMGLAWLSPEFYRQAFIGVPEDFGPMLRYAWVGGSIWGAMLGALLALPIGSILFAARWRRLQQGIAS